MVNPSSFHNITKKWVPEIRAYNPSSPIILVGTQSDLLLDVNVLINLDQSNVKPVLSSRARGMAAKIRATDYIECSSLTQKNLKEAFDAAIFAAIKSKTRKVKKRRSSDRRTKAFSRCSWKKFFCFVWTQTVNPVGYGQNFYLFQSLTFAWCHPFVAVSHPSLLSIWLTLLLDAKWCKGNKIWAQWALGTNICGDCREDSGSVSARVWEITQDSSVVYITLKCLIVLGQ